MTDLNDNYSVINLGNHGLLTEYKWSWWNYQYIILGDNLWVQTCKMYLRLMQSTQQIDNNMLYLLGCFW